MHMHSNAQQPMKRLLKLALKKHYRPMLTELFVSVLKGVIHLYMQDNNTTFGLSHLCITSYIDTQSTFTLGSMYRNSVYCKK